MIVRNKRTSHNTLVGWLLATLLSFSSLLVVAAQRTQHASPFSFAIVADSQIGMVRLERDRENFAKVVKAINELKSGVRPSMAIIAGDLVDHANNQRELDSFIQVEKTFAIPVYLIPGNHDLARDGKHFEWLEQQLRHRNQYRHVFIIQHHPLYLEAADEADEYFNTPLGWRTKLLRLFERARVTAVFTGHLHRNQSSTYHGIAMITTPSSCRNFDGSAFGYALVTVTDNGFSYHYRGVPGTLPDERPAK